MFFRSAGIRDVLGLHKPMDILLCTYHSAQCTNFRAVEVLPRFKRRSCHVGWPAGHRPTLRIRSSLTCLSPRSLALQVPNRTIVQIRTHAQKYFAKLGKLSEEGNAMDSGYGSSGQETGGASGARTSSRLAKKREAHESLHAVSPGSYVDTYFYDSSSSSTTSSRAYLQPGVGAWEAPEKLRIRAKRNREPDQDDLQDAASGSSDSEQGYDGAAEDLQEAGHERKRRRYQDAATPRALEAAMSLAALHEQVALLELPSRANTAPSAAVLAARPHAGAHFQDVLSSNASSSPENDYETDAGTPSSLPGSPR